MKNRFTSSQNHYPRRGTGCERLTLPYRLTRSVTQLRAVCGFVVAAFAVTSCEDPYLGQMFELDEGDDSKITHIAYMERHSEEYSMFLDFLKYADYYNALNDASTTVTVFAPDNDAMRLFMEDKNITSFDQLTREYARQVVQVHLLRTSLSENSFIQYVNEGSISIPTLFGDYLKVSYGRVDSNVDDEELPSIHPEDTLTVYLNNMASVLEMAHQTVNGMVYRVGGVVRPLIENVLEKMHDFGEFTIFLDAISRTAIDKTLTLATDTIPQQMGGYTVNYIYHTVFAVADDVYRKNGIDNVDALVAYLKKNDMGADASALDTDSTSALHRYVSYHVLDGNNEKSSLLYTSAEGELKIYDTREPHEILTIQTLVGETFINGGDNGGCGFIRSDIKASNGVIHKIDGIMPIWCPEPSVVTWDFCNSTDVISIANSYGAANNLGNLYSTPCDGAEYKVDISETCKYGKVNSFTYTQASTKSTWLYVGYWKCKANADPSEEWVNEFNAYLNNLLIVNLGYTGSITFTTPTLVRGAYRVEFYYAGAKALAKKFYGGGSAVKFTIDDYMKQLYLWKGWDSSQQAVQGETLFEKIVFNDTGSHSFRAVLMDVNASTASTYRQMWDYVKFVPVEE